MRRRLVSLTLALVIGSSLFEASAQTSTPGLKARPPEIVEFEAGAAKCDASLRTARLALRGSIRLSQLTPEQTKATVAFNVNGVAVGADTFPIERAEKGQGLVRFSRAITLPGDRADGVVVLTVDGVRLPLREIEYSCLQAGPRTAPAPTGSVRLPDLEVKPLVIFMAAPTRPAETCERRDLSGWDRFWNCGVAAPRLEIGSIGLPAAAIVVDPNERIAPIHSTYLWQQPQRLCPIESDALVTVFIAVAFLSQGVEDPTPYVGEGFWESVYSGDAPAYEPGGRTLDVRYTQRFGRPHEQMWPMGYRWALFQRRLPCTRNGTFEYTIDAANQLRESDESNNTIRVRYATVAP